MLLFIVVYLTLRVAHCHDLACGHEKAQEVYRYECGGRKTNQKKPMHELVQIYMHMNWMKMTKERFTILLPSFAELLHYNRSYQNTLAKSS